MCVNLCVLPRFLASRARECRDGRGAPRSSTRESRQPTRLTRGALSVSRGHRHRQKKMEVEKDVKRGAGGAAQIHRHGACPQPPRTPRPPGRGGHRPHAHRHTRHRGVIELQGYYNKRTISVYTGEGERRVIAVAAPRVGSCLLTAFLNRRSSAALSISAPPRNPALDWPK